MDQHPQITPEKGMGTLTIKLEGEVLDSYLIMLDHMKTLCPGSNPNKADVGRVSMIHAAKAVLTARAAAAKEQS